ncbi:hypothetical protein K7402_01050 [Pseudomonas fluorescens group sp.]|nr:MULTISPECIES: hypothetical protein [Pseudomonas fluorescens group]MBZ6454371.1 hypothetical protein [Pseudomonas fluorescens group sp.]MBZ6460356.1 hypothetical protein [Pseudomonas fluorescens group sp.]MBZ6465998.1 hypothetical protein [Pseudomonas fluorescens group sp.]WQD69711.1 hypothetical protein U0037_16725 [Pseudomonas marginalis]
MAAEWLVIWNSVLKFISSDSAPAWVQAVGSIVALYIAIRVSRTSIAHAGLQKQKTILSVAEAAYEYAGKIRAAINLISVDPGSNLSLYGVYHRDVNAGLVRALQGAPVHELASGQQVLAILGISNQLVFLGDATDKLLMAPSLLPGVSDQLASLNGDLVERQKYLSIINSVLKSNVLLHLNEIEKHYTALKESITN